MQLSDIDLLDRDRFTQGIPHEWFTFLRNEAPVYKHPEPDGPGFWVVTKYADVVTVGRDGATYSSDQKRGGVVVLEEMQTERLRAGRQPHAHDGRARAHALPQAREPRLHAPPDRRARRPHPRADEPASSTR